MGMNTPRKERPSSNYSKYFRAAVALSGAAIWLAQAWGTALPAQQADILLSGAVIFAALFYFAVPIFRVRVSLAQVTFLGIGILFGAPGAIWSVLAGLAAGGVIWMAAKQQPGARWQLAAEPFYQLGLILIPALISNAAVPWQGIEADRWQEGLLAAGVYLLVHALLVTLGVWAENRGSFPAPGKQLLFLAEIEILPLPFLLAGWLAAAESEWAALVILGGVPVVFSVFLSDREFRRASLAVQAQDLLLRSRQVTEEQRRVQAREELTETLVHDLRSPVGAVKASLELLEGVFTEGERDPVVEQALGIARRSTERVLALVDLLLDTNRLESEQVELEMESFDLPELISALIEDMLPLAVADGILLTCKTREDIPALEADREILRRVLVNLVDNALKFTPEGGQVHVAVARSDTGDLKVSVTDTGPGVPEEFREEVFSRFVQAPGTLGKRRGAGLGLAFCRAAVEAHGGKIWIEDADGEGGARFVFTLLAGKQR
jgi:signal transduction histidine kinase